jgi:hypothetical protein
MLMKWALGLVVLVGALTEPLSGRGAPVARSDTYTVAENGVLRPVRQVVAPVSAVAEVNNAAAANTIDGNRDTYWQATGENPAITFDLGAVRRVAGIRESTGGFPGNPFVLLASVDGATYVPVTQGTLTEQGFGEHLFAPLSARYLRLHVRRTNTGGFGELAEFQALAPAGVLANDSDCLTATLVRGPKHGVLVFRADGSFTYWPNRNFSGMDHFTYKARDSNTATVTITVTPVPR